MKFILLSDSDEEAIVEFVSNTEICTTILRRNLKRSRGRSVRGKD